MEVLDRTALAGGGGEAASVSHIVDAAPYVAETCATVVGGAVREIVTSAREGLSDLARFLCRFAVQYPDRSDKT